MTWLALLPLWLSLPPAVPYSAPLPGWNGRVYTSAGLHVGVRVHTALEGAALTVQVSL